MTQSATSVALAGPTLSHGSGAGCSGVDPAGTLGRCRARRRSQPGHHGSRWCRCVQSSARSNQPPASIQTSVPRRMPCAGAGHGSHLRTTKATRYRQLSCTGNRTATTSSTAATAFPSRERCSSATLMLGSQALGGRPSNPPSLREAVTPGSTKPSLLAGFGQCRALNWRRSDDRIHPFRPRRAATATATEHNSGTTRC